MDISSLNLDYYANRASDAKASKLSSSLTTKDMSKADDEELMAACKQFESYFVEQVLKQAMETFTSGTDLDQGSYSNLTDFYKEQLMSEYAGKITDQQDLGLAKTLYEQMKRNYSPSDIPSAEADPEKAAEAGLVSPETDTE